MVFNVVIWYLTWLFGCILSSWMYSQMFDETGLVWKGDANFFIFCELIPVPFILTILLTPDYKNGFFAMGLIQAVSASRHKKPIEAIVFTTLIILGGIILYFCFL